MEAFFDACLELAVGSIIIYIPYVISLLIIIPLWNRVQTYFERKVVRALLFALIFTPASALPSYGGLMLIPFPCLLIFPFGLLMTIPAVAINWVLFWIAMELDESILLRSIAYALMLATCTVEGSQRAVPWISGLSLFYGVKTTIFNLASMVSLLIFWVVAYLVLRMREQED